MPGYSPIFPILFACDVCTAPSSFWRMSIKAAKWTFFVVVLCASFITPFHSCPLLPLHLEPTLLGVKDLLLMLLGFPRLSSLRDRPPESSEPYVTLGSPRLAKQSNI